MSCTFIHFLSQSKNMLESLEFMKNQFLWGPIHPQIFIHDELWNGELIYQEEHSRNTFLWTYEKYTIYNNLH